MGAILTNLGEEFLQKNSMEAVSITIGLYNDATDLIADGDDLAAITTEPADGNYVRQSATLEVVDNGSGDWQAQNTTQVSFDVTNTTGTVDSYFVIINFTAVDTGDGATTDHLVLTGALSQSYDLSNVGTLNINAGSMGFSVT